MELPLVLPYFDENGAKRKDFGSGVNFAVGGATALHSFPWSVSPLKTQMGWFKELMSSLCRKSPGNYLISLFAWTEFCNFIIINDQ